MAAEAETPPEGVGLRVWEDLGIVDTIFEEEGDDPSASNTPSISPMMSPSPSTPLHSLVDAWSSASGEDIDVVIYVEDSCFYLHKAPLKARSGYMRRHLKSSSELTLTPTLPITAETFTLVIEFCYGAHIVITPFNVAPLLVAAELLEMTESNVNGKAAEENLCRKTEAYFRRAVAVNKEYATIVLRSGVSLLPEAETAAGLVSRCIEALMLLHDGGGGGGTMTCLNDVVKLQPDEFQVVVESMNRRLTSHDSLYRVIAIYLKGYTGKMSEEQKTRMCNNIDCTLLSSQVLMHAVQNSIMPLRFIVQAMFIEQLHTRRSIISVAGANHHHQNPELMKEEEDPTTLGALLQRDAALRQVAQLKEAMETTNSRIRSLQKELIVMRKRLHESSDSSDRISARGRSQSFRVMSENKIEKGQIGSISSGSFLSFRNKDRFVSISSNDQESESTASQASGGGKKLGRRFMDVLKSAFGVKKSERNVNITERKDGTGKCEFGDGDNVVVIKKHLQY